MIHRRVEPEKTPPTNSDAERTEFSGNTTPRQGRVVINMIHSEILIPPEPLHLWPGVPVDDIAFLVLEVPRDDNKDVPLPDPDFLFYFSFDPAHPCHTVKTADPDMVCTHHQFSTPEHFPVTFLGQFYPDDLIAWGCSRFFICQCNLSFFTFFIGFTCLIVGARENIFIPIEGRKSRRVTGRMFLPVRERD